MQIKYLTKIITLSLVVFALTVCFSGCTTSEPFYSLLQIDQMEQWGSANEKALTDEDIDLGAFKLINEDGEASLLLNEKSCEIAVKIKKTGVIWFSNPQNRFKNANGSKISTQIEVTTLDKRDISRTWDSYLDAVLYGQFKTEKIDNGVRITYLLGKLSKQSIVPIAFMPKSLDAILSKIKSSKDQDYLKRMFVKVNIKNIDSIQTKDTLLKQFPILEKSEIYTLKLNPSKLEMDRIENILLSVGYTIEDKENDLFAVGYIANTDSNENIQISVDYAIENGSLKISVPVSEICVSSGLKVAKISLLKYFGVQQPGSDGFIFVPDGSGGIINFNKVKSSDLPQYSESVYGDDYGISVKEKASYKENIYLPVYGVSSTSGAYIAVIEKGAAIASINADGPRSSDGYPSVSAVFQTLNFIQIAMDASPDSIVNIYPKSAVKDDIALRFLFLDKQSSGYDSMAVKYREYLQQSGQLSSKESVGSKVPFIVDFVGAIDVDESIAGIPMNRIEPLTTLDQAEAIITEIGDKASDNELVVRYSSWRIGGFRSGAATRTDLEPKLGNARQLQSFFNFCNKKNIDIFYDVDFQYIYKDKLFDGYKTNRDSVKYLTGEIAFRPVYNKATFFLDRSGIMPYILRPDLISNFMQNFSSDYMKKGGTAISISSIGKDLYSDYNDTHFTDRNKSLSYIAEAVKQLKEKGLHLASEGCNSYILNSIDFALSVPVQANSNPILDNSVPFLQIVLSGSVKYSTPTINLASDLEFMKLKSIETGSSILFSCMAAENDIIIGTKYEKLYSHNYKNWEDRIVKVNDEVTKALSPVYGYRIIAHSKLADGIYKTVYENNVAIIVNYNSEIYKFVSGTHEATVNAGSYTVIQAGSC